MSPATVSFVAILSLLVSMSTIGDATLCQLSTVKESASAQVPGGWNVAEPGDAGVVSAMRAAVVQAKSGSAAATVTQEQHVLEAFTQIVAGTNYCIRFSASGACNNYYCKSYECIASGHRPLSSDDITSVSVECNEVNVCDIEAISESSKTQKPGGWSAAPLDDDRITRVQHTSSKIATVGKGSIVEAYQQAVAGRNYCIRFNAQAGGNCGHNCKSLTCVAGGFDPLPHQHTNPTYTTKIGVACRPTETAVLGARSNSAGSQLSSAALLANTLSFIVASVMK